MYLDFFVILNDTDRAREIERAIKYGEIKYGERESNQILRSNMEREREIKKRSTPLAVLCMACKL